MFTFRSIRFSSTLLLFVLAGLACSLPIVSRTTAEPTESQTIALPPGEAAAGTPAEDAPTLPIPATNRLMPNQLVYRGAFRLPQGGERPFTFAYGGAAITFDPQGDPGGAADGFPGSLFIMGHDRLPYGELPDGNQVAEISIPLPVTGELGDLPTAGFLQNFADVARGQFAGLDELPRAGLLYLDHPLTGPLLHLAWGQHFQEDENTRIPSHAWISPDLSSPNFQGGWTIDSQSLYSVNGYLFEVPSNFVDAFTNGYPIATGRYRDGGWSGMGPALFAYRPWDERGDPLPAGSRLPAVTLLRYESSLNSEDFTRALAGYAHADEWEGGAWITTAGGRSAVVFVGTKATGDKTWYGWVNPAGAGQPCVEVELAGQFILCRLADGSPCPEADLSGCSGHNDFRGWWSSRFDAQMLFYDPAELGRVASGEIEPWQPQPYAVLDLDEHLLLNPDGVETEMIGSGDQRRYRIGEMAYDRANGLLYILELFADGAQPVVHVWQVNGDA